MAIEYVQVIESENDTPIELPTEENGTLLLSTVTAQFPGASGLKYKVSQESKSFRGVKLSNGLLHPPPDEGWNDTIFYSVYPKDNKRKHDDTLEGPGSKVQCLKPEVEMNCTDLIVLGIPYTLTEKELKRHFEKYGEVVVAQIKTNKEGMSKGYGFIRFSDYNSQTQVLMKKFDKVGGKLCEVKIPNSKEGSGTLPRVFVDKLTEDMTEKDVKAYFRKYGDILDLYMPKNYRAFCFITFSDPEVVNKICGKDHTIKGTSVSVSIAVPKSYHKRSFPKDRDSDRKRFIPPFKANNYSNDNDRFIGNNRDQRSFNNQGGNNGGPMDLKSFAPLMGPAFFAAALSQAATLSKMGNFTNDSNVANGRSSMSNSGSNMDRESRNMDYSSSMGRESRNMDYSRNMDRENRKMDFSSSMGREGRNTDYSSSMMGREGRNMDYSRNMDRENRKMDFSSSMGREGRNTDYSSSMSREGRNTDYGSSMGREGRNTAFSSSIGREGRTTDYGSSMSRESGHMDYSDRDSKGLSSRFNDRTRNERDMPTFSSSGGKPWERQYNRDNTKDDDLFRFRY